MISLKPPVKGVFGSLVVDFLFLLRPRRQEPAREVHRYHEGNDAENQTGAENTKGLALCFHGRPAREVTDCHADDDVHDVQAQGQPESLEERLHLFFLLFGVKVLDIYTISI